MENKKYIVDRFEDPWFVCERVSDKKMFDIHYTFFKEKVNDGEAVVFSEGKYIKDENLKKSREEMIREKFERLKG